MKSEKKQKIRQKEFAEESGLAIIVTDDVSKSLTEANNNSMCRFLYNSEEFAPRCAEFCGKAFELAHEAEKAVSYRCYAGLNCVAVPFEADEKPLVAIVGRTFLKAEKYREATERASNGDWKNFPPAEFFDNVLLSSSANNIGRVAKRIENLSEDDKNLILRLKENTTKSEVSNIKAQTEETAEIGKIIEQFQRAETNNSQYAEEIARRNKRESEEISAWRKLFGSLLTLNYRQACASVLKFIGERYGLESLAWLELRDNNLEKVLASGRLKNQLLNIGILANDKRILNAARRYNFPPKAINQIKTALVEACINASEHSHSPDRKIYQKIAFEDDKIIITISNRGLRLQDKTAKEIAPDEGRRGWGLKLMQKLMDEVKFEQVDDGTRISMAKYLERGRLVRE